MCSKAVCGVKAIARVVTAQLFALPMAIIFGRRLTIAPVADTLAVQLDIAEQVAGVLNVVLDDKQRESMRSAGVRMSMPLCL